MSARTIAVIARDNASFQRVCFDLKLKQFEVLRVMHPDNLRGANLSQVVWDSTPFNWDQSMIEEARVNVDVALRVGEDPKLTGNAPMTRREAIAFLKAEVGGEVELRQALKALGVSGQELDNA